MDTLVLRSALLIQRVARGRLGRNLAARKEYHLLVHRAKVAAAVMLQRAWWRFNAKANVARWRNAVARVETWWRFVQARVAARARRFALRKRVIRRWLMAKTEGKLRAFQGWRNHFYEERKRRREVALMQAVRLWKRCYKAKAWRGFVHNVRKQKHKREQLRRAVELFYNTTKRNCMRCLRQLMVAYRLRDKHRRIRATQAWREYVVLKKEMRRKKKLAKDHFEQTLKFKLLTKRWTRYVAYRRERMRLAVEFHYTEQRKHWVTRWKYVCCCQSTGHLLLLFSPDRHGGDSIILTIAECVFHLLLSFAGIMLCASA